MIHCYLLQTSILYGFMRGVLQRSPRVMDREGRKSRAKFKADCEKNTEIFYHLYIIKASSQYAAMLQSCNAAMCSTLKLKHSLNYCILFKQLLQLMQNRTHTKMFDSFFLKTKLNVSFPSRRLQLQGLT